MTFELPTQNLEPGYAGPLQATRDPALAGKFHFWRGISGQRYACTRFPAGGVPAYEDAVALFIRRTSEGPIIIGAAPGHRANAAPHATDEVHIHLVRGGTDAVMEAYRDLSALIEFTPVLHFINRQAA
jgi:hypothetical protein